MKKGLKVQGSVRTLTNFGAFVDIGGIEGLLHISDISWGKINHPSEVFKVGDEIEVVILDFNEKEDRISLGYKQMSEDPWENIIDRYMEGQKIAGKVVSLTDFGAFVELEPGVEGLVHISDLTWSRKLIHPKKILSQGEDVVVTILSINPESKRISLGLKQSSPHPLEDFQQKYSPGSRVKGKITSITDFGGFLEVDKGIEGLIHISDISWKKIRHPSDVLKQGDEIEVIILNIDVEKQKLSLGIKQLEGDIWEDFFKRQRMGDIVHVKIIRIADFGVFVEITPGIEGVVFLSELDENKIENPGEVFKVGEQRNAKLIKLNQKEKKISLSFRQALLDQQKMEYQRYSKSQDGSLTLGDIMRDQLNAIDLKPKQKDGGKKVEADKPTAEKKAKPTAKKKTEETPDSRAKEKTAKVEKPKKKEATKTVPKKKKAEEKTAKKEKKEESPTKNKKEDIVNKVAAKAKNIEEDSGEKEEKKND